jgi:hypothetical protein
LGEFLISDRRFPNFTMISTKRTAALIAAMSLLGTVAPAAFAQVSIPQTQSNNANQGPSIPIAIAGPGGTSTATSTPSISQGSCQNAAGADRGSNATVLQTAGFDIDCS